MWLKRDLSFLFFSTDDLHRMHNLKSATGVAVLVSFTLDTKTRLSVICKAPLLSICYGEHLL